MTTSSGADMNLMTNTLERKPAETASISDIAETTANACLATRVRQLSRIVTRVYDDAMRPLGITASRLKTLGLVDKIVPEPLGGAHRDPQVMSDDLKGAILRHLHEVEQWPEEQLLERRYARLRAQGVYRAV